MNWKRFAVLILFAISSVGLAHAQPNPEASQEVRTAVAKTKLTGTKDTVLVYARGLCCPSCAIGVRKKVSQLSFVDTDKPNSGVELDAVHQLVTVAIKPGISIEPAAIRQAINDAGYAPVHLYSMVNQELVTLSIE